MPVTLEYHKTLTRLENSSIDFIRIIPNHDKVLVTASKSHPIITLWDVITVSTTGELPPTPSSDAENSSTASPTTTDNQNVKTLLVMRGQLTNWSKSSEVKLLDLCVTHCGETIIACYSDKSIRIWNWQTFECKKVLNGHSDSVLSVDVSLDGSLIISSSKDNTIRLWNINGNCLKKINSQQRDAHTDTVLCVRFLKCWATTETEIDHNQFLSYGKDGCVKLWQVKNQSQCYPIQTMNDKFDASKMLPTPDSSFMALSGMNNKVEFIEVARSELKALWDVPLSYISGIYQNNYYSEENELKRPTVKTSKCIDCCFSPNRYWLTVLESNGQLFTIDLENKTNVHSTLLSKGKKNAQSLVWSNDGTTLFVGFIDGTIQIFKTVESSSFYYPTMMFPSDTVSSEVVVAEEWLPQENLEWE